MNEVKRSVNRTMKRSIMSAMRNSIAFSDHRLTLRVAVMVLLLASAGCRDLGTAPEIGVPSSIVLDRDVVRLGSLGQQAIVRALVLDQNGREMTDVPLIWFTEDPSVATVEADQQIRARRNGETKLQVVVDATRSRSVPSGYRSGGAVAEARVVVRQEVGSFQFNEPSVSLWAVGQSRQMSVEVRDPMGTPFERAITVRWESGNPAVIDVTPEGRVVARDDGAAQVRAVTDEGAGAANVQVATRFTFAACVSSSASRMAANLGGRNGAAQCADTSLRAFVPDSIPDAGTNEN
jgi:hypothetical protein